MASIITISDWQITFSTLSRNILKNSRISHFEWSAEIRVFDWSAVGQQWKIEVVLRVFMMLYAKIYGPYDGSNFYLFQFKFWIHFRLTKTESIKEVPNWHWRRFMNKLFLVAWGLKCFKPFIWTYTWLSCDR